MIAQTTLRQFLRQANARQAINGLQPLAIIRFALAALFFVSGAGKLWDGADAARLAETLARDYGVTLPASGRALVVCVSLAELAAACALAANRGVRAALYGVGALVALFTPLLAGMYWSGTELPSCGCSGALGRALGPDMTPGAAFWRNVVILAVVAAALALSKEKSPPNASAEESRATAL